MKHFTITLIAILAVISSCTQPHVIADSANSTDHLTFKGVPIDGKLSEYILKMEQNGFTEIGTEDRVATLKGDFASYKGCTVLVATLKGKDLVSKISVVFPLQEIWSSLSSNYFNLKKMLTEKYGKPVESVEKFGKYTLDDDESKMIAVHQDNCKYITTYQTDKGSIELSIKGVSLEAAVVLTYIDKVNGEIIRARAKDDL